MYQVIIKGKTLEELKKAIAAINEELKENSKSETDVSQDDLEKEILSMVDIPPVIEDKPPVNIPSSPKPVQVKHIPKSGIVLDYDHLELDSEGLPWDSRIHASSRAKLRDGTWRIKRGLDDASANVLKAELRKRVAHLIETEQSVPVVKPIVPSVVETLVIPETIAPVIEPVKPQIVEAPVVQAPLMPVTSMGHTLESFKDKQNFPMILADLINRKLISQEYIETLKNYFQVLEIWMISDEQKEQLFENFVSYNFIQKVG